MGFIFVGCRITKVGENSIAEISADVPFKAANDRCTSGLILMYHLAQVFRIKLLGKRSRTN